MERMIAHMAERPSSEVQTFALDLMSYLESSKKKTREEREQLQAQGSEVDDKADVDLLLAAALSTAASAKAAESRRAGKRAAAAHARAAVLLDALGTLDPNLGISDPELELTLSRLRKWSKVRALVLSRDPGACIVDEQGETEDQRDLGPSLPSEDVFVDVADTTARTPLGEVAAPPLGGGAPVDGEEDEEDEEGAADRTVASFPSTPVRQLDSVVVPSDGEPDDDDGPLGRYVDTTSTASDDADTPVLPSVPTTMSNQPDYRAVIAALEKEKRKLEDAVRMREGEIDLLRQELARERGRRQAAEQAVVDVDGGDGVGDGVGTAPRRSRRGTDGGAANPTATLSLTPSGPPTPAQAELAQKHSRFVSSALQYDDVDTAVKESVLVLRLLLGHGM